MWGSDLTEPIEFDFGTLENLKLIVTLDRTSHDPIEEVLKSRTEGNVPHRPPGRPDRWNSDD